MSAQNLTQNLLVELFVEELPPKALKKLGEAFSTILFESLKTQGLTADNSQLSHFATPRRLAAHITNIASKGADKDVAQRLMPAKVGLDADNKATPALTKRLGALGEDASAIKRLRIENDGKTDMLFLDIVQTGTSLQDGLQKALEETLAKLPIPKVMSYQLEDGWTSVSFVRPAHRLVALHGAEVVEISILGLNASNQTQGHRFESKTGIITIKNADTYVEQLKNEGAVIASFTVRREEIINQLNTAAAKEGLKPIDDEALLDEVTALVEMPNVLLGQFEKEYLDVPQECLILTMKANQKYFPLLDNSGKLTNKFLIVSNINPTDTSAVIGGNERVIRPRLADAKFFFDQDRKKTLESRLASLSKVVYHHKLGSQAERNMRVVKIATTIAEKLGDSKLVNKVEMAAKLSKADLITDMVGEFPSLQGIMGRYYAQHEKLDDDIAFAIEDHYKPRFAGDALPRNPVGICVALADKLETLVGLFCIGEKPSGDKDPFALRRQALGVIRILIEQKPPINFDDLIKMTISVIDNEELQAEYSKIVGERTLAEKIAKADGRLVSHSTGYLKRKINENSFELIKDFCFDRLSVNLRDQGASAQEANAVLSLAPNNLSEIPKRLAAVRTFSSLNEAPALVAANKRIGNILKKSDTDIKAKVNANLLQEPAEKALADALAKVTPQSDKLFESGDYTGSLQALATLKAPIDAFFDNVMVNADDPALKTNRLGLLATLHQAMNRVADLSKLAN